MVMQRMSYGKVTIMPDWTYYYSSTDNITTNSSNMIFSYALDDAIIEHINNACSGDVVSIPKIRDGVCIITKTPEERAADAAERRLFPLFFLNEKR